jgi:PAS domain S-box-containing protein
MTNSHEMFDDADAVRLRWPRVGRFSYFTAEDRWEWSDAVAEMHGYESGTVSPTTELVLSHKHPDDNPDVALLIEQVRRNGVPFSSRHRIIDTKGHSRLVVVVAECSYGADGEITGTTGFYVDVTEQYDTDVQRKLGEVIAEIESHRAVINQAMGMLMLVYGVSADRAFDVLTWRSSETNVKVREIAARLVSDAAPREIVSPPARSRFDHLFLTAEERIHHHTD